MKVHADCRHFDGFKPCRFRRPCEGCPELDRPSHRVLLINLDAMGDVVRTTALLAPLRRALPGAHVTWITLPRAVPLLDQVEGIDRVIGLDAWVGPALGTLEFDLVLGVDKSLRGGGLAMAARAKERRGFGIDGHGAVVPLNREAEYLYRLGLDDAEKFAGNRKPETQLLCEAMGWEWERDPYGVRLGADEVAGVARWRGEQGIGEDEIVVGFNTGSSDLFPYKRLTIEDSAALVDGVAERCPGVWLALLGGPEDTGRNREIGARCGVRGVIQTSTEGGLRRGMQAVAACDVVASGDSLGMHLAIGLGKPTVVWFGPSCHQEIDLYGDGAWVLGDVDCRPCMRSSCDREPKCLARVPLGAMADEVAAVVGRLQRGEDPPGEVLVGDWPAVPRIE